MRTILTLKSAGTLKVPNDTLQKKMVLPANSNQIFATGQPITLNLVENPSPKKSRTSDQIITPVALQLKQKSDQKLLAYDSGDAISIKLDQNARDVLAACINLKLAGNEFATISAIYHVLTGDNKARIDKAPGMKKMIIDAVNTLMISRLTIDMSEACKQFRYNKGKPLKAKNFPLLPATVVDDIVINGMTCTAIHFLKDSPIYTIAAAKNQLLTIDLSLFNVPKQNNTPMTSAIKHYLIYRVKEIKAHAKNLTPTITYDDVFEKCGLTDATKYVKQDARKIIDDVLNHLLNQSEIKSFETIRKGQKIYATKFIF